jgi:hypothetical protein
MNYSKMLAFAATGICAASLGACSSMDGGGRAPRLASGASDEKAFATTFAACRDQVRAGKTDQFAVSSHSAVARDLPPGDTGLILKAPYDKARGGTRASRVARDDAHKMAMGRCLDANGYRVAAWEAASR